MNSGKVPVNVLKRSVLRQLKNKKTEIANSAGLGADCAIFEPFSEGQLVTCVQEGVVELQCENDLAEAEREDLSVMPMRRMPLPLSHSMLLPRFSHDQCSLY